MFNMQLIPDWRSAWRWFSVQALALIIVLPIVWASLPPDVKSLVPSSWNVWIFIIIAFAGLVGRFVDQKK